MTEEYREGQSTENGIRTEIVSAGCDAAKARRGISKVGMVMMVSTLLFWLIPWGCAGLIGAMRAGAGNAEMLSKHLYAARFLGMYLLAMPLMIFLLSRLPETKPKRQGLKAKQYLGVLAATFGIMIVCNLVGTMIAGMIGKLVGVNLQSTKVMDLIMDLDISMAVIFVSVIGPIYEELIFRRMLVSRLLQYGEGVAMVLSALMFGIFHGNWSQFVYAFGLGLFLAFLYIKTGDIRITISLHVAVNFCSSVLLGGLMKWAKFPELMQLVAKVQETGDMSDYMNFVMQNAVPILCLFGFILLEYGVAILGVVLLIVFWKQMKLDQRDFKASRGEKAKVMFWNVGTLAFFAVWLADAVSSLVLG